MYNTPFRKAPKGRRGLVSCDSVQKSGTRVLKRARGTVTEAFSREDGTIQLPTLQPFTCCPRTCHNHDSGVTPRHSLKKGPQCQPGRTALSKRDRKANDSGSVARLSPGPGAHQCFSGSRQGVCPRPTIDGDDVETKGTSGLSNRG